jgi:hypothetical protein
MARGFRRKGRGSGASFVAMFDPAERDLVAGLMEQVHDLLDPPERRPGASGDEFDAIVAGLGMGASGAPTEQDAALPERDAALSRLLPVAHADDDEVAAEFRRLTESGLRTRKATALADSAAMMRAGEDRIRLDPAQALAFLTALTDVRLVLGERLGLRTDGDAERLEAAVASLGEDSPLGHALALYDFLTWLQETLAQAMLES